MKQTQESHRVHMESQVVSAVKARNIQLNVNSLGSQHVILKDFNLTVPQGTIYGLLGPSGGGKTSFLRCVIGLLKPSSGILEVFGCTPGQYESGIPGRGVGYMPQEIALESDLTIEETLTFYGRLCYMSNAEIFLQSEHLVRTLDLPKENTPIGNLSGGQQRRVSFACAIMHNPRLVILDEPTVGVDPVLRVKIWDHLVWLSETHSCTIIITTHYIEEARRSNTVGFVRKGSVLIEDSPEDLKERLNCTNLDEVFWKVCYDQKAGDEAPYKEKSHVVHQKVPLMEEPTLTVRLCTWWFVFSVLTRKLLVQMEKNPTTLIVATVLTIATLISCTSCVGPTPHHIPIAIFNEERPQNYSKLYLDMMSGYILIQKEYMTMDEAFEAVRKREALTAVHIRANFSNAITAILFFQSEKESILDWKVEQSKILMYGDVSHQPLFSTIERIFEQTFVEFVQILAKRHGHNPRVARLPIQTEKSIYGRHLEGDYGGWKDFEASGFSIAVLSAISYLSVAPSLLQDRTAKIFERNYAVGISTSHLVFGHLFARFLFTMPLVFSVLVIDIYVCELLIKGSLFLLVLVLCSVSLCSVAFGIMVSSIFDSSDVLLYSSNGLIIFIGIMGGLLWPKEGLPYWLRWLSDISILSPPMEAFRSVTTRGWGLTHPVVYRGFSIVLTWAVSFVSASVAILEFKK